MDLEALLHRRISEAALPHFTAGQYRSAALDAIIAVFDMLRERTGLDLDGDPLITEALSLKKPRLVVGNLSTESGRNSQVGLMMMLQGAFRAVRNPHAHSLTTGTLPSDAARLLAFCSFLAERVDEAQLGSILRYDGFYQCPTRDGLAVGARLLRFYQDGCVVAVSLGTGSAPPDLIWSWFTRENAARPGFLRGTYTLDDRQLLFSTASKDVRVDYRGEIDGSRLHLRLQSSAGASYEFDYEFVPIVEQVSPEGINA